MIQFQPAQDVKDALSGKKTSADPAAPATPQASSEKPPLAMNISNSPKLAGIFKDLLSGTSTEKTGDKPSETQISNEPSATEQTSSVTEPQPVTVAQEAVNAEPEPAVTAEAAPTVEPVSTEPEPITAITEKITVSAHDPTDPHGIHDEAHPDEPEPITPEVNATAAISEPAPEVTNEPQTEPVTNEAPIADEPVSPPQLAPATVQDNFKSRLQTAIDKLDAEIAEAETEEARLLSEAAKATMQVKNKKAERKQLQALKDIDPQMLESVSKILQETDANKVT